MRVDFTTSNKDSLRGEPKKREGRGGEGKGRHSSLPNHSLLISLPSPLLSTHPTEVTKGNFVRFRIWGNADII